MVAKADEVDREALAAEGSGKKGRVPPVAQLLKHPLALLALVPSSVALFAAGAGAGAVAKTVTAPLDRVKILMQACSAPFRIPMRCPLSVSAHAAGLAWVDA